MSESRGSDGSEQTPTEANFLSRGEVARLFGVSASTVTRWARTGLLPTVRTLGGHYRFRAEDVRRAAESRQASAKSRAQASSSGPNRRSQ